jgi:hypothetical protein
MEERSLAVFAGMDSHNRGHGYVHIYLLSQQQWVFRWMLHDAVPTLQDMNTLMKVEMLMTDQDDQLMPVIADLLRDKPSWLSKSNLVYQNCAWHKLNSNLTDHKDFWLLISSLSDDAHVEWNTFVSWLWCLVR